MFFTSSGKTRGRAMHVRFWHLADMPMDYGDVCFRGKSGHSEVMGQCPLPKADIA